MQACGRIASHVLDGALKDFDGGLFSSDLTGNEKLLKIVRDIEIGEDRSEPSVKIGNHRQACMAADGLEAGEHIFKELPGSGLGEAVVKIGKPCFGIEIERGIHGSSQRFEGQISPPWAVVVRSSDRRRGAMGRFPPYRAKGRFEPQLVCLKPMILCGLCVKSANWLSQSNECASRVEENDAGLPLDLFLPDVHISRFPSMSKAGTVPLFSSTGTDLIMNSELIAMLDYLERERGINRDVLVEAISSALLAASKKNFTSGTRELRIDINPKSGAIRAMAKLIAVERIQNPHDEILHSKAKASKPDIQLGEEIEVEVTPRDFGRIAAQAARQAINQRIRQIEKDMIYEEFKDRAGEIVSGTVRRFEKSDVIIDLGKFEGTMPSRERVVTEEYSIGDRLRAYVVAVDNASRGPEIVLSRSHPNFVRRLFEIEVSEIADRTVELKAIAREAGYRTKVAVHSADPKVDPVGACVGMRGARVKNIVRELNNEKVDIIRWDPDPLKFAAAALKPANIRNISLDEKAHTVRVLVGKDDLSLAIGKRGQNARLTSKLTGWDVDIQEDKTAEQQLESQKAQAAHSMADVLGVSEEEAQTLTSSGMNSIDAVLTAEASDIAEVLGCDIERGQKILDAAKAAGQPTETAAP